MELNQKIHEWLGHCWHDVQVGAGNVWGCVHCPFIPDRPPGFVAYVGNPDYTTDPAAMLSLIEAVRAKGYGFTMYADPGSQWHAFANSDPNNAYTIERADEGTLPMAVARAVEKLIDADEAKPTDK